MAKPAVDGLEKEWMERGVQFVRLSATSSAGGAVAAQYGVRGVPTLIVFDDQGQSALTLVGRIDRILVRQTLERLLASSQGG